MLLKLDEGKLVHLGLVLVVRASKCFHVASSKAHCHSRRLHMSMGLNTMAFYG